MLDKQGKINSGEKIKIKREIFHGCGQNKLDVLLNVKYWGRIAIKHFINCLLFSKALQELTKNIKWYVGNVTIQTQHSIVCGGLVIKHNAMQKTLKIKFGMDPKSMLLNIVSDNISRIYSDLEESARILFAAKWNAERCPNLKDWKEKFHEYTTMAKQTLHIW